MLFKLIFTLALTVSSVASALEFETTRGWLLSPDDQTKVELALELAVTPEQRRQGLMYRTHLPPQHGMLFIWPELSHIQIWMANTFIPLDVLFLKNDEVVAIYEDRQPLDRNNFGPAERMEGVLELPAGSVAKFGVTPGWRLQQAAFVADVQ